MTLEETQELCLMLLIENRSLKDEHDEFFKYLNNHYDLDKFNNKYIKLVDKYMTDNYALNKTEKSEEHD